MGGLPLRDQGEHRAAEGFGAAEARVGRERGEGLGRQLRRRRRKDRPVRDQEAPARPRRRRRGPSPDSASAPSLPPAAVLQADSTTQSALSSRLAISEAVSRPSSASVGNLGWRQHQGRLG